MPKNIFILIVMLALALTLTLLSSCGNLGQEARDQARIQAAVAATLVNIPTQTPHPTPQIIIPPTPLPLDGLFCGYGFCIGHPADLHLVDALILRNAAAPSTRAQGILFAYNPGLFMQVIWSVSGPSYDYSIAHSLIMEETDQKTGSLEIFLRGNLNVYYQPIGPTASDLLPHGAIASWQCGGRDFAWKIYTPQDGMAQGLLQKSLERFRCE